jgi:predicted nucleic acid-binding protein
MVNPPIISLDTNVFIFGFRNLNPASVNILQNLFQFEVEISFQVERELRKNMTEREFRQFYDLIGPLPTVRVIYHPPDDQILSHYRELGLKTGDAYIAAFCEQESIDILISENRHFLGQLPQRSFQIVDSQTFCKQFIQI